MPLNTNLRYKKKQRIKRASSFEAYARGLGFAAGTKAATEQVDVPVEQSVSDKVQQDFEEYVAAEVCDIIKDAEIFFSDDVATAISEFQAVVTMPTVVNLISKELNRTRKSLKPYDGYFSDEQEELEYYANVEAEKAEQDAYFSQCQAVEALTYYNSVKEQYETKFGKPYREKS